MRYNQIQPFLCALLAILSFQISSVQGISRCSQRSIAAASLPRFYGPNRQRPLLVASSRRANYGSHYSTDSLERRTRMVARTKKKKESKRKSTKEKEEAFQDGDPFANRKTPEEIYADMGPIALVVAGTIDVAARIAYDYIGTFLFAYVAGTVTDLPRFFFRSMDVEQQFPLMQELSKRYGRMHGKSVRWGKSWGSISAVFGGCGAATRVARRGKEDQWNQIISSASAGAFFARKDGPQGMLRGALFYGMAVYLFSGGGKEDPSQYTEQPIDF